MICRAAIAVVLLATVAACSGPPTQEHDQAIAALSAARAADAATYAPDELASAESALKKYDDAVAQKDYRQALNDALQARDLGYESVRQANDQKAALQTQAQTLIAELDRLIKSAAARLSAPATASPRLGPQAAERLRAAHRAGPPALQEARTLLDQKDAQGAIRRVTPVIEALRRELEPAAAGRNGRSGGD